MRCRPITIVGLLMAALFTVNGASAYDRSVSCSWAMVPLDQAIDDNLSDLAPDLVYMGNFTWYVVSHKPELSPKIALRIAGVLWQLNRRKAGRYWPSMVKQMTQAMAELITNAMEHGNKFSTTKLVRLILIPTYDEKGALNELSLSVTDEGPGYDPNNLPHAMADGKCPISVIDERIKLGCPRPEGGFGLYIIKNGYADRMALVEPNNQAIITWEMGRRLSPTPALVSSAAE